MGQIVRRKKKGRPPKVDPGGRVSTAPAPKRDLRRSVRRRNVKYVFDLDDYFDEDELFENYDDQRQREKKLKHLLKLQSGQLESESTAPQTSRHRRVEHAPDFSDSSSDGGDNPSKKRKIIDEIDEDVDDENDDVNDEDNDNEENDEEITERKSIHVAEDSTPGTPPYAAAALPLPDKKALELILDKLQKKDIYGVFAEPVDPEELPDYHDIIKHPMDFDTLRNKLRNGAYKTMEQFESDIFLICSNAMQYNAPDTIYHKQARSIKELAIRKFHKIRLKVDFSDKYVKSEQKLKYSSIMKKQIQSSVIRTVQEPPVSGFSPTVTLAMAVDLHNVSSTVQDVEGERPSKLDVLADGNSCLNENILDKGEESLPGKGLLSRFSKKSAIPDDNRRATYDISLAHPEASTQSMFSTFEGESKQLVPVGLYSDHSYARSLARFAATLGSVAWEITSKRIEQTLPQGFKFGQGWVGEYELLPTPVLIIENCNIKEPPFLAKVKPPAEPRKYLNAPVNTFSSKESLGCRPVRLSHPSDISQPPPSTTTSFLVKEQPIRANASDARPSFFWASRINPGGSTNISNRLQSSQFRTSVDSDEKSLQQFELKGPPAFNKNAAESIVHRPIPGGTEMEASRSMEFASRSTNFSPAGAFNRTDSGVTVVGLPNGKALDGRSDSGMPSSSPSHMAKAAGYYQHDKRQVLNDPVQATMKMPTGKAQNQQISSNQQPADTHPQVLSSASSPSNSYNIAAATAAARAWMSVGAGGFRPAGENINLQKNQTFESVPYRSPRDIQPPGAQFRGEFASAGGMVVQPDRNSSLIHAFVPQGTPPVRPANGFQFPHQPMVYPQLTADLSRFQRQPSWRNLSPQMHPRQKQDPFPPDLNIGFQSSGSPGGPSSGVLVDSQQPDLALQL